MKRVLTFTGDYKTDNRRYALMQQAFLLAAPGGAPDGRTANHMLRALEVMRVEASLLDKLDGISEESDEVKDNPQGVPARRLRPEVTTLELTKPEHSLMLERMDPTHCMWVPAVAGDVVRLIDWFDSAEKVE